MVSLWPTGHRHSSSSHWTSSPAVRGSPWSSPGSQIFHLRSTTQPSLRTGRDGGRRWPTWSSSCPFPRRSSHFFEAGCRGRFRSSLGQDSAPDSRVAGAGQGAYGNRIGEPVANDPPGYLQAPVRVGECWAHRRPEEREGDAVFGRPCGTIGNGSMARRKGGELGPQASGPCRSRTSRREARPAKRAVRPSSTLGHLMGPVRAET